MDPGSIARGRQGKRQLGLPIKEKDYTMRPNRLDARANRISARLL